MMFIKKLHHAKHFRKYRDKNSTKVMYSPCEAIDNGAIEMVLNNVPRDCLSIAYKTDVVSKKNFVIVEIFSFYKLNL